MRVWAEVDAAAIRANVESLRRLSQRPLIAVVKANGYGLGATIVAKAALDAGARSLAVATVEEAEELKKSFATTEVIVLGGLLEEEALAAVAIGVEPCVHAPEDVARLARAARSIGRKARVHVEVDSGLSRHGVEPAQALDLVETVLATPGLELAGIMTHFARAASRESVVAALGRFDPVVQRVRERAPRVLVHAAASAASVRHEDARYDAIRPGLMLQGIDLEGAARAAGIELEPALALRAKVVRVRSLEANTEVGYGATFRTKRPTRLAVVGLGYDDGLPHRLSNNGSIIIKGTKCPIVGTVMMDNTIVDVTDAPIVEPGDTATAIGRDGFAEISVDEVARAVGVIPYAITCGLGRRVKRVALDAAVPLAEPILTTSARQRRLG